MILPDNSSGIFPIDAQTFFKELQGIDDAVLSTTSPLTILGLSIHQSGTQSESNVMCGSVVVSKSYAKDLPFTFMNFVCNDDLKVEKTAAGDDAFFVITIVPYDITKDSITPIATISTASSSYNYIQQFTTGDIVIGLSLIFIGAILFADFVRRLFMIKTIRR